MRFHLRERAWHITDDFLVRDDAGNPIFDIRGKFFSFGDDLALHDYNTGEELVHINQRLLSFMPHYEIYRSGQLWADVHEQFRLLSFLGERFSVEGANGVNFHIEGDIWDWNYSISDDNGNVVAQVGRQFTFFQDSYAVDVAPGVDAPFIIALAVVIEMVREKHEDRD